MTTFIGVDTTKEYTNLTDGKSHAVLERHTDHVGNVWVYVQASVSIAQYAPVLITKGGKASQLTGTNARVPGYVGVLQANINDGNYGWALVQGKGSVNVLLSCQPNVALFTTNTSGYLDDSTLSTSQFQIIGIIASQSQTSGGSGAVLCTINNPNVRRLEV